MGPPVGLPAADGGEVTIRVCAVADGGKITTTLRSAESGLVVDHVRAVFGADEPAAPGAAAGPVRAAGDGPFAAGGGGAAMVDGGELYGTVCFQAGRFRRIAGLPELTARSCRALAAAPTTARGSRRAGTAPGRRRRPAAGQPGPERRAPAGAPGVRAGPPGVAGRLRVGHVQRRGGGGRGRDPGRRGGPPPGRPVPVAGGRAGRRRVLVPPPALSPDADADGAGRGADLGCRGGRRRRRGPGRVARGGAARGRAAAPRRAVAAGAAARVPGERGPAASGSTRTCASRRRRRPARPARRGRAGVPLPRPPEPGAAGGLAPDRGRRGLRRVRVGAGRPAASGLAERRRGPGGDVLPAVQPPVRAAGRLGGPAAGGRGVPGPGRGAGRRPAQLRAGGRRRLGRPGRGRRPAGLHVVEVAGPPGPVAIAIMTDSPRPALRGRPVRAGAPGGDLKALFPAIAASVTMNQTQLAAARRAFRDYCASRSRPA